MAFPVEPQAVMRPGIIELRWGDPDPRLIPVDSIAEAARAALEDAGAAALNYGANQGPSVLRGLLADRIERTEGRSIDLDEIVVTAGNTAAIDHLLALTVQSGDVVLVEDPSYKLAVAMFRERGVRMVGVPVDDQGIQVETLPETIEAIRAAGLRPRLLYTIPTFHNPTGVSLSDARRRRLLEVAGEQEVTVLEDDAYRDLCYEGQPPPSLWSLAGDMGAGEYVARVGTFSKTLAPGLRCGWLTASPATVERFAQSGLVDSGGCPSQFTACVAARLIMDWTYEENVGVLRDEYGRRRSELVDSLRRELPDDCRFNVPSGGYYVWLNLPEELLPADILSAAEAAGVSFAANPGFSVSGDPHGVRLSFSMYEPAELHEAAARLGHVIARALDNL